MRASKNIVSRDNRKPSVAISPQLKTSVVISTQRTLFSSNLTTLNPMSKPGFNPDPRGTDIVLFGLWINFQKRH